MLFSLISLCVDVQLPALTSKSVTSTPLDLVVLAIPLKIKTSAGIWMAAQWTIDAYANGSLFILVFFCFLFYLLVAVYVSVSSSDNRCRTWILVLLSVSELDVVE